MSVSETYAFSHRWLELMAKEGFLLFVCTRRIIASHAGVFWQSYKLTHFRLSPVREGGNRTLTTPLCGGLEK